MAAKGAAPGWGYRFIEAMNSLAGLANVPEAVLELGVFTGRAQHAGSARLTRVWTNCPDHRPCVTHRL